MNIFQRIIIMLVLPGLAALGTGMAAGWFIQADARAVVDLSKSITVSAEAAVTPRFSTKEKRIMNRCVHKWKGVIDTVHVNLHQMPERSETTGLHCAVIVNSPENLVVVARQMKTDRQGLVSGITTIMNRAGEALCAMEKYGPECADIRRIHI